MKKFFIIFAMLAVLTVFGETVYDVQYSTTGPSPLDGSTVTVSAVVTATGFSGDKYFISDPEGGPWRGVYVYDYSHSVNVGDWITLTAEVDEYYDLTELKNVTDFSVDGTEDVPAPHAATCSEVSSEESLEGVLVVVRDVSIESVGTDEWVVTDGTGSVSIGDGFDYTYTPEVATAIDSIIGVVNYSYGNYILEPRSNSDIGGAVDTTTPPDTGLVDIADIQANPSAYDEVTVQGIITLPAGATRTDMLNAWIQDESGRGIQLFAYDMPSEMADFARGMELRVTGTIDEYNGVTEITSFSYEVISSGNTIPSPVDVDDVWSSVLDYEGTWIMAQGEVVDIFNVGGGDNITVSSPGGNEVAIRIWETTGIDISELSIGDDFTARGVGGIYSDAIQILPALQEDISFEADTSGPDTSGTDLTPIADIQADPGSYTGRVTIEGIITIPPNTTNTSMLNAWIQDESGRGVQLFDYDMPSEMADFARGVRMQVTGSVDEYNGVTEIVDFTYEFISSGNDLPEAANIDAVWNDRVDYEGTWTTMTGYIADMYSAGGGMNITVETDGGHESLIRVWESTGIEVTGLIGDRITAYGVGSIYSEDYQMLPALAEDISIEAPPPAPTEPVLIVPEAVYWHGDDSEYTIEFGAPIGYTITLRLFDRLGRECGTLYHGNPSHQSLMAWDGRDETGRLVQPGTYLIYMTIESELGSLDSKTETIVIGSKL